MLMRIILKKKKVYARFEFCIQQFEIRRYFCGSIISEIITVMVSGSLLFMFYKLKIIFCISNKGLLQRVALNIWHIGAFRPKIQKP